MSSRPIVRALPLLALMVALSSSLAGCSGGFIPRAHAPEAPSELAKCKVAASQGSPLVTEWPASEKANLEARLQQGGVAVAYSGCEMRLLPQCQLGGSYAWQRTTTASDAIEIRSEDELYAKLPLGAVSLEGELRASGRLAMQTTVAGQLKLQSLAVEQVPRGGACQGATHLVGALSVGAFKLSSGGALAVRVGVETPIGGGGVGTQSSETVLREAGDPARCKESSAESPHADCRSPIQVFLFPLPWARPEQGPPGTVKVAFVTADAEEVWEVMAGGRVICKTPCQQWLSPNVPLLMRQEEGGFLQPRDTVEVPSLRAYAAHAPLEVRADTKSMAGFTGGLTATSLGGVGLLVGGILMAVGCPGGNIPDMCTAGAVSAPIGLVVLVPGIWLTVASGADAEVVGMSGQF